MRTTVIAIILICGFVASAYSQINQNHKRHITANSPSKFHYKTESPLTVEKRIKPNGFNDHKIVEPFLSNDNKWASRMPAKISVLYNMPVYEPQGEFSMRIIKPDTTTKHTMLIKRF